MRDDLGNWIRRRLEKGVQGQGQKARAILADCEIPVETLREQWELQKEAQLSLRARVYFFADPVLLRHSLLPDAPARLKHELDTVLGLQGDLDTVETAIQATHSALTKTTSSKDSLRLLTALESTHSVLKEKVEALYASLNVHDSFPELRGIDLEFVRTLLMARDLKINIRKRAIGSFFEWDKLDQAAGGRDQAIGMRCLTTTASSTYI